MQGGWGTRGHLEIPFKPQVPLNAQHEATPAGQGGTMGDYRGSGGLTPLTGDAVPGRPHPVHVDISPGEALGVHQRLVGAHAALRGDSGRSGGGRGAVAASPSPLPISPGLPPPCSRRAAARSTPGSWPPARPSAAPAAAPRPPSPRCRLRAAPWLGRARGRGAQRGAGLSGSSAFRGRGQMSGRGHREWVG